jgi:predicted Zn-dependent peptidase
MTQKQKWADFSVYEQSDPLTGKNMRTYRHASGLLVKVLPRPGFSRHFAAVTIPFGSIFTTIRAGGATMGLPAGTAHFLEHCLFSRDGGGGLLGHLSELGASANAYTTHSHTMYYFSTVHHFQEALDLYLDSIGKPYLEEDRVAAEKPIILAELDQYLDDPDTRCYMQLLENMYVNHPVRFDIGGTADSVTQIHSADLKTAWGRFYQPAALMLTLAGDFEEKAILDGLSARLAILPNAPAQTGQIVLPDEPALPQKAEASLSMDVTAPSFLVGFKDPGLRPGHDLSGLDLAFRQKAGRLLLETLLSPASPLFDSLYGTGLINDSFGFHYVCEDSFAFMVCGGESPRPDEAAAAVRDQLIDHVLHGVDPGLFENQKRVAAGDFVRSLDSVEHSGMIQAQCNLYGIDLFDYPGLYDKMDCNTVSRMMDFLGNPDCCTTAMLHPEVKNNHDSRLLG